MCLYGHKKGVCSVMMLWKWMEWVFVWYDDWLLHWVCLICWTRIATLMWDIWRSRGNWELVLVLMAYNMKRWIICGKIRHINYMCLHVKMGQTWKEELIGWGMLCMFIVYECTVMLMDEELEAEMLRFHSSLVSNADGLVTYGCWWHYGIEQGDRKLGTVGTKDGRS